MAPSITASPSVESPVAEPSAGEAATASAAPSVPAAKVAPTASPVRHPRVILVVDDQSPVCTAVSFYLEVCGYKTFRAASGHEAIAIFSKEQIDGVLMDVQMPLLNGFETCRQLHRLAAGLGRKPKVWFMTALSYPELDDDCAAAGGLSVFQKPFDWPLLLAELDRGLNPPPPAPVRDVPGDPGTAPS